MLYPGFYKWMVGHEGLAAKTAYLYATRMSRFAQLFGDIEQLSPPEVAEIVVVASKSPADHNSWVSTINKYQTYHAYQGHGEVFTGALKVRAGSQRLPKPFTEEEIDNICHQVPVNSLVGRRDRAVIELLYCGLRNQEVCNTTLESLTDGTILVYGKGAKERYVPINDIAWAFLLDHILLQFGTPEDLELAGEHGLTFAFITLKERKKLEEIFIFRTVEDNVLYPRAVRKIIEKYAKEAQVLQAHPHRFRHSFATHTLDAGLGNFAALKDVLGHTKFDMVQRYVLTTKIGRERVKSFHPRQRKGPASK